MMTSSNGNIFRVTGHLYVEFTGHRWIPCTKYSCTKASYVYSDMNLNKRLSKQSWGWWFETTVGVGDKGIRGRIIIFGKLSEPLDHVYNLTSRYRSDVVACAKFIAVLSPRLSSCKWWKMLLLGGNFECKVVKNLWNSIYANFGIKSQSVQRKIFDIVFHLFFCQMNLLDSL